MIEKILTGDQAIAQGAKEADVRVITGYPGSPGTKVLTGILELYKDDMERHIEWSVNEKVAFENALGASLGGDRAMVCLKSVGMNITIDPIMTANLTGINAGLVILLGDDPGALLSQNEQDTRLIFDFLELPLLEPSSPQEAKDIIVSAFDISETFQTIVVVREIRSLSVMKEAVQLSNGSQSIKSKGFLRKRNLWISTTFNVLDNHKKLHKKLIDIEQSFNESPFNKIINKNAKEYIITAGFAYQKLMNVFQQEFGTKTPDDFAVLKLGTIFPLPKSLIKEFLKNAEKVLVLEDNEPYIENKVKEIAHDENIDVKVLGKTTGHVTRIGEFCLEPGFWKLEKQIGAIPADTGELEKTFCDNCPYTPTFEVLSQVIKEIGERPAIIAEPGCAVRLNAPPFEMLDIKYSMGSAIGIASGIAHSRSNIKPIAVCGDSSFFHTGMNALMNVIQNRVNIFILVLDNSVSALTGYQPHPGSGFDIRRRESVKIQIEDIARSCQVPSVAIVTPDDPEDMYFTFRRCLTSDDLSLVVVRKPCPLA